MASPKKIGFNGRPFCQNNLRGLGRHTLELILSLKRQHPEVEIFVYSYDRVSDFYREKLPFVTFRDEKRRPKILWDIFFLGRDVGRDKIEIFHSTNNLGVPLLLSDSPRIITTIHDTFTHVARNELQFGLKALWDYIHYRIEFFLLKRSSGFLTVSETAKKEILQEMNLPSDKIHVAYNGSTMPTSSGQGPGNFFLYVGGFEERKNIQVMLEAVLRYNEELSSKVPLILVGKPEKIPSASHQLLTSWPNLFQLKGGVSDDELIDLYHSARALIFPSKEEGFGLPLIEAMRSGLPVIASDIPVFREIAGDACRFFPPHDAEALISELRSIESEALWRDLQDKGLKRSKIFSWDAMASTVYNLYYEVSSNKLHKVHI